MSPISRSIASLSSAASAASRNGAARLGVAVEQRAVHGSSVAQGQSIHSTSTSTSTPASASTGASATRSYATETTLPSSSSRSSSSDEVGYASSPKETAAIRRRVEEELLLKLVTATQPLAALRRPASKVPYEHASPADGPNAFVHPSGFVVPAPPPPSAGNINSDTGYTSYADTRARAPELLTTGFHDNVRRFADLTRHATAYTEVRRSEKVPQEVEVDLPGADGRMRRAEHPSGFVPPSPQAAGMRGVKECYKPVMRLGEGEGEATAVEEAGKGEARS